MNSISENIKVYRLKFNYSNKALSKVTGISRSYLSDLENGNSDNLSVKKLYFLIPIDYHGGGKIRKTIYHIY